MDNLMHSLDLLLRNGSGLQEHHKKTVQQARAALEAMPAVVTALRLLIRENAAGRTPLASDWTKARTALASIPET